MKIIFSPSKDMAFDRAVPEGKAEFNSRTLKVIEAVNSLSREELKKALKASDEITEFAYRCYKNIDKGPFYEGLSLYNGMSFRELDRDFNDEDRQYLTDHLLILSALYGPVKPFDLIAPYRLDMNSKIKVEGQSLKNYWKDCYNSSIEKGETVFNLASDEFSSLFNRDEYRFADFIFYKEKDGKLKTHSTTSKKSRGIMLNHLCRNRIESIEELKDSTIERLTLKECNLEENRLIYILED